MGNFDISLGLGLCLQHDQSSENCCIKINDEERKIQRQKIKGEDLCNNKAYPSLTLGLPDDDEANYNQLATTKSTDQSDEYLHPHASSPSVVSSFSNSSSIKRERDHFTSEEFEPEVEEKITPSSSRVNVEVDENGNPRKKLRLTKEQSAVLEDSFKDHSTLNPMQKQELARKLNLRTRQVEVWFQNRRARTKLKQTEVDCELLKKCYETLTEENKRLQKDLQELKSMKITTTTTTGGPFYMQLPVATNLTVCPSCKTICSGGETNNNNSGSSPITTALPIGPKALHLFYTNNNYNFTQSSAAC